MAETSASLGLSHILKPSLHENDFLQSFVRIGIDEPSEPSPNEKSAPSEKSPKRKESYLAASSGPSSKGQLSFQEQHQQQARVRSSRSVSANYNGGSPSRGTTGAAPTTTYYSPHKSIGQLLQEEMRAQKSRKRRRRRSDAHRQEEVYTDKDRAAAVNMGSRDIKQSLKLKRKQDRSKALQIPEEAEPSSMLAHGLRELRCGNVRVARNCIDKRALELSPKDKNALIARSRCHLLLGEPQKALADAELALRGRSRDPRNAKALYSKAEALYYLGDFELSLVYFYRGMTIRPEFDQFRLGVQKAKEAIQNILGGNPVPMPETPGPVAAVGTGERQRETTTATSSTSQSSTRADSKGETSRSSCGRTSAGGTAQTAPPSAGTTTQLTGSQQLPQQQQQRRSSSKRSSANVSNGNNLLGHLTRDKKYLQELIKRPDIKAAHQSSAQNIIAHAEEGLHFLKTRQEFWKQQCNARQQSSSSSSRRWAATST